MSVDKVQSFGAWVAALSSEQKTGKTISELRSQYNNELSKGLVGQKQEQGVGVTVEKSSSVEGDAETRDARSEANKGAIAEIAEMKEQANLTPEQKAIQELHEAQVRRSQNKKAGEYAPVELTVEERAVVAEAVKKSGKDKPLYDNKKAQKELTNYFYEQFTTSDVYKGQKSAIAQKYNQSYQDARDAGNDEEATRIYQSYQNELNDLNNTYRSAAKAYSESLIRKDKIEHTRVFDTEADKKAFKKENEDLIEKEGLRLKVHHSKYIGEQNVNLHHSDAVQEDGISLHQAAYETAANTIGSDKIGDPNEVQNLTDEAALGTKYKPVEKELKRLGYDVKDDTWKNIAKALIPGAGAFASSAAFTQTVTATANALAVIQNPVTGEILKDAASTATATKTLVNWAGAGAAGAAAAVISAALFGETEDEHVLNGTQIDKVFQPSVDGKKYYQTSTFGKYTNQTKIVLEAIDKLPNLTDEEKTAVLREAAGVDSREFLSSKELIAAYMAAEALSKMEKVEKKPPEEKPNEKPKPEMKTITPEVKHEIKTVETKPVYEEKFRYERQSGEYWIGIAGEMYLRDGKPISPAEADILGHIIKAEHGFKLSDPNMPSFLELKYTMEYNGITYTLKDHITRNPYTGPINRGRQVAGQDTGRELIKPAGKEHSFNVTVTEEGQQLDSYESGVYGDTEAERQRMKGDIDRKESEFTRKYPSRQVPVETEEA